MYLSQAKIANLEQEYQALYLSLKKEKEEGVQKGGPMDSFKEAAAVAVNMGAKDEKVSELRNILAEAQILPDYAPGDIIQIGKWFSISGPNGKRRYRLVDPIEADPQQNLVSELSPLGQLVLNQKKGTKFVLNSIDFVIVNIE
jgi:transcription elongation GreA/GreB family factor